MVLKADINQCTIEDWESNTGELNARVLQVELCEELSKCENAFVTFELDDGTVYEDKVTDGKVDIPTFDRPQFIKIGVYAEDAGVKRYSSKPTYQYVDMGSYTGNGENHPIPTASAYAELLEMIKTGGSNINIIDEFGFPDDEYNRNDVYNANALNSVIGEIAENFASVEELNRSLERCDENYKKADDNLKSHINTQALINANLESRVLDLGQRVVALEGQSVVIDEISDLVGGAE